MKTTTKRCVEVFAWESKYGWKVSLAELDDTRYPIEHVTLVDGLLRERAIDLAKQLRTITGLK